MAGPFNGRLRDWTDLVRHAQLLRDARINQTRGRTVTFKGTGVILFRVHRRLSYQHVISPLRLGVNEALVKHPCIYVFLTSSVFFSSIFLHVESVLLS